MRPKVLRDQLGEVADRRSDAAPRCPRTASRVPARRRSAAAATGHGKTAIRGPDAAATPAPATACAPWPRPGTKPSPRTAPATGRRPQSAGTGRNRRIDRRREGGRHDRETGGKVIGKTGGQTTGKTAEQVTESSAKPCELGRADATAPDRAAAQAAGRPRAQATARPAPGTGAAKPAARKSPATSRPPAGRKALSQSPDKGKNPAHFPACALARAARGWARIGANARHCTHWDQDMSETGLRTLSLALLIALVLYVAGSGGCDGAAVWRQIQPAGRRRSAERRPVGRGRSTRRARCGGRRCCSLPAFAFLFPAFGDAPVAMLLGLAAGRALMILSAWLAREGLRARAAWDGAQSRPPPGLSAPACSAPLACGAALFTGGIIAHGLSLYPALLRPCRGRAASRRLWPGSLVRQGDGGDRPLSTDRVARAVDEGEALSGRDEGRHPARR